MEASESMPMSSNDIILRYGLIAGGMAILCTVLLYIIDDKLILGYAALLPMLCIIVIGVIAAIQKKKVQNGYLRFGDGVVVSLGTYTIGLLVSTLFSSLLMFVIDTSLLLKKKNMDIERIDKMLSEGKISKERYNAAVQMMENMTTGATIFNIIIGFIIFIIVGLIIYLITSAIIKNENPFNTKQI